MNPLDPLADIVAALDVAEVPYMVVGSTASSHHGVPRATQDIDIVIDPTTSSLARLLHDLGPRYYVPTDAAQHALPEREMFNVVDTTTGWKIDVIVLEDVSNLIALRTDDLDNAYMDEWAARLGVVDLLERARSACEG